MNLYEIDEKILDCIDMETGELIDADKLAALSMERDAKIENICLWVKNLKAEAEMLKAEKKAFEDRQKAAENKMERLKWYLATYLNGEKFETAKVAVSYRKTDSVEIEEGATIPEEYLRYKEPEPKKDELKKAIKAGQAFEGISIVTRQSIQIK